MFNSSTPSAMVTGSTGFIGFHLVKSLLASGYHVVGVDNFCRSSMDERAAQLHQSDGCSFIECDLADPAQVAKLPDQFDYIFHLAAMNGTQNFYEIPYSVVRNCTLPTLNLIEKYRRCSDLKCFFYAGTSETYASTVSQFGWEVPTDESVPLSINDITNVRWSYAIGKLSGESACIAAAAQYGFPFVIGRFHNIYGPRNGDKHFIPDFVSRCLDGRYELFGHRDTRSFLFIDDAIAAIRLITTDTAAIGEVINVGSANEVSIHSVATSIMEELDIHETLVLHPSPAGSVSRRCPDISKLESVVNFQPKVSLNDGLRKTIDDIKKYGV